MGNQLSVIDPEYTSSGIMKAFHITDEMNDKGDDENFDPIQAMPTTMPNKMKEGMGLWSFLCGLGEFFKR